MGSLAPLTRKAVCTLVVLAGVSGSLSAQEVQWRSDYVAARNEAQQKQRPLVIDFGTANCFWCRKLDSSTFRDPAIARQLNEKFIPLKIDADREAALVQHLKIKGYPTLVFASPDGRILGAQEGFVDAARFGQQLQSALQASGPPVPSSPPVQLANTPPQIQQPQGGPIIQASASQYDPAVARELLTLAEQDQRQGKFLSCLDRCDQIAVISPESQEAVSARQLATQIRSDPSKAARLAGQLVTQLAELHLAQAQAALNAADYRLAVGHFERVLQVSPGTPYAQTAQRQLERLKTTATTSPGAQPR